MTIESTPDPAPTSASYAERRAAMADQTRVRILEACVAILGRGVAELSVPAVAREAGVSVPTVYRNFPDKRTLLNETALYLKQLRGPIGTPPAIDDVPAYIEQMFVHAASLNETVRIALASTAVTTAKRELGEFDDRAARIEKIFGSALDEVAPQDREMAKLVCQVLCSSATMRAFREVANATPERAAEAVAWALSRVLDRPWQSTTKPRTRRKEKR